MNTHEALFAAAQKVIPGGVNSPVRAFQAVGQTPRFIERGQGPYLYDVEGKQYVDYIGSWGPLILGHAAPNVIEAVKQQLEKGLGFGTVTAQETEMAELISTLMPAIEQCRLVSSGTEATMSAIRLARAYTERRKIIKFAGCYHGHSDSLLVNAGSGALTFGSPSSPGVLAATTAETLVADFNDLTSVETLFTQHGDDIAAIIVEPVAGNMNCVLPDDNFLSGLRHLCDQNKALLIFDEVMTGFRVALGGAQAHYQIKPDLTTLGKIIGGGLPVGAFGGRAEIMALLAPNGPVYQAGTLSGNPVALSAGLATLRALQADHTFYQKLSQHSEQLCQGLKELAQRANVALQTQAIGGMFGFFFTDSAHPPRLFSEVSACNQTHFQIFHQAMLEAGIYLAPSAYEASFISSTHDDSTLSLTLQAAERSFTLIGQNA